MRETRAHQVGDVALAAAVISLVVMALALAVVFGPAQGTPLDRFVLAHIGFFRDTLGTICLLAPVTFFASFAGDGLKRAIGIVLSALNFFLSLGVLGAGA